MTTARRPRPARARRAGRGSGGEVPGDPEQSLGDPESVARTICLRMLDRRACSRVELAEALAARDVPADAANRVLDRFAEVGLVDDAALAQLLAGAQHRERGLARRALAQKLRQRGLADDVVAAALEQVDADGERTRAEQLVAHRLRSLAALPPQVQVRRLVGLLARKGYPPGLAHDVVRRAVAAADELADAAGGDEF